MGFHNAERNGKNQKQKCPSSFSLFDLGSPCAFQSLNHPEDLWWSSNLNLYPALLQGINSGGTGEFSWGGRRVHLETSVSFELFGLVTMTCMTLELH